MSRRGAIGVATAAAAGTVLIPATAASAAEGSSTDTDPPEPPALSARQAAHRVGGVYQRQSQKAGGTWYGQVSVTDTDGTALTAVSDKADTVVSAYSVNKVAVAVAVLDKVDRGLIRLDQTVEVSAAIVIATGDGIFRLDRAYPSQVTVGHALASLLTVSDDTAVRLCGLVAPAREINQILVDKGFPNTQVVPVANPNRFFLGNTTPRETHDLLRRLVNGELLSAASTDHLLSVLRSPIAFTDGIRQQMSSDERLRVGTKAGWFNDGRHEAGIMFDPTGRPVLTYALFAFGQAQPENFGATHPALKARAAMGRRFLDIVGRLAGPPTLSARIERYEPVNGEPA
jgi:beta-lactamase class A